ncbi:MAG: type restriction enzyme subunit, partial [Solirubrobacteraceae bacterium]|nr:type restriction enzyme subunit [Solirubrobacteraceae bacterium]
NTSLWVKDFKGNDPRFISYLLKTVTFDGSTASAVPGVNRNHLHRLAVARPPLRTQRRIVSVLAALDQLVEINERRIDLLEDVARSLYDEWLVRFRFPGHEGVRFVESEIGLVPEGWELRRLGDLVTTQYGLTASAVDGDVGPRFLRGMDINKRSYIDWSAVPRCDASQDDVSRFQLQVGDICVIRMADPGKVGIVEASIDAVFASYLVRIRSNDSRLPPYLLFHYLDSEEYQSWVSGSSTGSTRKSASAAVLVEPRIVVPPAEIASMFEARATSLRRCLAGLVEACALIAATRELLLPRLVTGRLDISDIDLGDLLPDDAA